MVKSSVAVASCGDAGDGDVTLQLFGLVKLKTKMGSKKLPKIAFREGLLCRLMF
jgi:hypothetical protein